MHIDIDEKAHLHSILHRMDLRLKIISILASSLIISSCRTISSAAIAILYAAMLTFFSGIPITYYLKKTYLPLIFLLPLFLFLPLSSGGDVLLSFTYLSIYKDGIILSVLISFKVTAIIILINIMLSTAPFRDMAAALRSLKVPDKMLNIILFTYRYFFVFFEDLRKMRVALTLRGFRNRSTLKSLRSSANLAGSLLVRSYEQTERIYRSMLLRGYNGRIVSDKTFKTGAGDILLAIIIIAIPLMILFSELKGLFI
ncbi:MAG TPA: cobalt ECF transporter T component CbiQ [Spirochaetota bacterium]|nr:cobalt ECF transporter T component CbiQ [Spirochaetota bacterium]HPF05958.1 cobalt ECF transporter T component CbiQ [Spirochaetota bacterium]HPJ41752.1 cobalt ECF transporter T component CbiQ [Spirochaetota bacterium]HPR36663.1 cobalt ECF transporter T component CbiQ [Spirochaetota bacterium]HRX47161.1 cobalt ECF transporter T component CbiQ [Spirochaetota bacterium]